MFSKLPKKRQYTKAIIAGIVMFLLVLDCFLSVLDIFMDPTEFVVVLTLACLSCIFVLAYWNGPGVFLVDMFDDYNKWRTLLLFSAMFFSLVFALWNQVYFLDLVCCVGEVYIIIFYIKASWPDQDELRQLRT